MLVRFLVLKSWDPGGITGTWDLFALCFGCNCAFQIVAKEKPLPRRKLSQTKMTICPLK